MSYTSLSVKEVKIRKPQKCLFCRDQHEPGQKMVYHAGVFDGDFQSYYSCTCCHAFLTDNYDNVTDGEGGVYEDFVYEADYKDFKAKFNVQQHEQG